MRARRIEAIGIVQGVGLRPFVYRIASQAGVTGYAKNVAGSAVEIWVEGTQPQIETFEKAFRLKLPPGAVLDEVRTEEKQPAGFQAFEILKSDASIRVKSMIPPDFSICPDCLKEVMESGSRWYDYPFNSCAYCGPRYSMMSRLPYDRENTSMLDFPLCDECLREYRDPLNRRRFHAQGISCPSCGPRLTLYDAQFNLQETSNPIREAARLIDGGYTLAEKGLGGYHIAAKASDDGVVARLRARKRRPEKPFAIMAVTLEVAEKLIEVDGKVADLLTSPERPIVLSRMRREAEVSQLVAPGLRDLGVFLPYTAMHYLLLSNLKDGYAIMTSGNPTNEPMCIDEECVRLKLRGFVDYFLAHNRRILSRVDDSVVRLTLGRSLLLRRGRGYSPIWIRTPFKVRKPIIAFGAMLQNAGAVAFDDKFVLTQYVGDCDEFGSYGDLDRYLRFFTETYGLDASNSRLVVDKHPNYPTVRLAEEWAERFNLDILKIQHHWAHIAAVMAEHRVDEEVLGIAIDGMGYGLDGQIWGGEVLHATYSEFQRLGHLRYQVMPGGDLTVEYPARMLASILSTVMEDEEILNLYRKTSLLTKGLRHGERELEVILRQTEKGDIQTSSLGRVLDAISTLLGLTYRRTYEGEPAIKLEASAESTAFASEGEIPIDGNLTLDTSSLLNQLLSLVEDGRLSRGEIAYVAQYRLGWALGTAAARARKRRHRYVAVSGGAAVNEYILRGIYDSLAGKSLSVLVPVRLPPGDGGVALGQAAIAAHLDEDGYRTDEG